jgi:KDO2-lipid IV(A) lauroyltransferase
LKKGHFYRKYIRPVKHAVGYLIILKCIFLIRITPRTLVLSIGSFIGRLVFRLSRRDRDIALKNIKIAFPEMDDIARKSLAKECFRQSVMNLVDMVRARSIVESDPPIWEIEGEEYIADVKKRFGGGVVITGHIGCFEIMAGIWRSRGFDVAAVGRRLFDKNIDRILVKQRKKMGIENIPSDAHPRRVISMIKKGYLIGTLIDTYTKSVNGIAAPFFGRNVRTISAPAGLARLTGTPLLPMAIFRIGKKRFLLKVWPPIEIPRTRDKAADIRELLLKSNEAIETMIRYRPDQWIWYHDRFRESETPANVHK